MMDEQPFGVFSFLSPSQSQSTISFTIDLRIPFRFEALRLNSERYMLL